MPGNLVSLQTTGFHESNGHSLGTAKEISAAHSLLRVTTYISGPGSVTRDEHVTFSVPPSVPPIQEAG